MIIQDELKRWMRESAEAGRNFSQIVIGLAVNYGYSVPVAKRIAQVVLYQGDNDDVALYQNSVGVPDIHTETQQTTLHLGSSNPTIAFEQFFPRIVLVDNFLSPEECDALCRQGEDVLAPAEVLDQGNLGQQAKKRSSFTARFPRNHSSLVDLVEEKIAELVDWPAANSEPLQIQRYLPGQQYVAHYDFFEKPSAVSDKFVTEGGQRLATLIVYLKQPEAGGATYFSNLGLRVSPRAGSALFFNYPDAAIAGGTMHCGEKVVTGEKWILTKWFRQDPV